MNDPRVNTQRTEDPPLFVLIVAKIDDIQNLFVTAFKEPKNVPYTCIMSLFTLQCQRGCGKKTVDGKRLRTFSCPKKIYT